MKLLLIINKTLLAQRGFNPKTITLKKYGLAVAVALYSSQLLADCSKSFDELLALPLDELMQAPVNVASKVSSDPKKQPASVTVVTREQLKLSAARTLNEALMTYVPGFFSVGAQDSHSAAFRGLAGSANANVMMLLNGHNLNTEWAFGMPEAIFSSNNFDWIDHIEVIRGPGSVTLGQGALLGVLNIVTRKPEQLQPTCDKAKANLLAGVGMNGMWQSGMEWAFNEKDYDAYVHVNQSNYGGQALRREGWAANQPFLGDGGGVIADSEQRLKRTENLSILGHLRYKQLNFDLLHVDQNNDLYNFYADRNQMQQVLTSMNLSHAVAINANTELESKIDATIDDYTLHSTQNSSAILGGTQENRYGIQEVLRLKELWQGNTLALGAEFHFYDMGLKNSNGDNFIVNRLSQLNAGRDDLNQNKTMVYPNSINIYSFFIEDNYQINNRLTLFAGGRYDEHKYWGNNFSPRLGAFYTPWQDGQFRLSYQQGFRGAMGLNYNGGYKGTGFLRVTNFDKIGSANIPSYGNLPQLQPEKLDNIELAFNQSFNKHWHFENVLFYNSISHIMDLAILRGKDFNMILPNIGSDSPSIISNAYWFSKNNQGSINQIGNEASLRYTADNFNITASHAFVDVLSASAQNVGSMYLSKNGQHRAYPQNVTRLNIIWKPLEQFSLGVNYLYYSSWYASNGMKADGGHLLNASAIYSPFERLELALNIKNILGEDNLYPLTNTVGDTSPGTPSIEQPTFWVTARLNIL